MVEKLKFVLCALCAMLLVLCGSVEAQQAGNNFRIGFLDSGTAAGNAILLEAFRQEMRKHA